MKISTKIASPSSGTSYYEYYFETTSSRELNDRDYFRLLEYLDEAIYRMSKGEKIELTFKEIKE